jgi:hypothetical protein
MIMAVVLLASPVLAGDMQAGVKGGVNLSSTRVEDSSSETDSRLGMALGGFLAIPMTPMFSIQPEALFSMKGDEISSGDMTQSLELSYLEIPVLAKLSLAPEAVAHPSVFVGPSLGINLGATSKIEGDPVIPDSETDVKDLTKGTEFGLVMGGGVEMPIGATGKQSLGLDVRYNLGLTSIDDSGADANVKNGVLSIMGTFRFL